MISGGFDDVESFLSLKAVSISVILTSALTRPDSVVTTYTVSSWWLSGMLAIIRVLRFFSVSSLSTVLVTALSVAWRLWLAQWSSATVFFSCWFSPCNYFVSLLIKSIHSMNTLCSVSKVSNLEIYPVYSLEQTFILTVSRVYIFLRNWLRRFAACGFVSHVYVPV